MKFPLIAAACFLILGSAGSASPFSINSPTPSIKHRLLFLFLAILHSGFLPLHATPTNANATYGNYLPERIGKVGDLESHGILFQPDRELMYDFDGVDPLRGVHLLGGAGEVSPDYFMSRSKSMKWTSQRGNSVEFDAGLEFRKAQSLPKNLQQNAYHCSLGLFLASRNPDHSAPEFRLELIGVNASVLLQKSLYLHKAGWSILNDILDIPFGPRIEKIRLVHLSQQPCTIYIDNVMLYLQGGKASFVRGLDLSGVTYPVLFYEDKDGRIPKQEASQEISSEEKETIRKISDRMFPPATPIAHLSEKKMKEYQAWYDSWGIETKGALANGEYPLSYFRNTPGDPNTSHNGYFMYARNITLCSTLGELGADYARCQDPQQKAQLGTWLIGMVRLAATYGGIPTPWYTGRGFAQGVYYGRDLLQKEGLLEPISRQIIMQYGVDQKLTSPPLWEKPPLPPGVTSIEGGSVDFLWGTTADHLNTASQSTLLAVMLEPDSRQKIADLKKLSTWYSRVGLGYTPNNNGAMKPDGSIFHHWGNRFDNYGRAALRGATDVLYWFSGTPFELEKEARERVEHVAETLQNIAFEDSSVGPPDYISPWTSWGSIMKNLSQAGSSLNSTLPPDVMATMSYGGMQIRRAEDWALTVHGISKTFYLTQYPREGFLFDDIGGLGLVVKNQKNAMWPGMKDTDRWGITFPKAGITSLNAGYHPSFAPCVTAVQSDWKNLTQMEYQRGSDDFVGGVSLGNHCGIFVQKFNAHDNSRYAKTVAHDLAFRKSYFLFDRRVVALGREISASPGAKVSTGILQEESKPASPGIVLGHNLNWNDLRTGISSDKLPWAETKDESLGVWFFPGQLLRGEDGNFTDTARPGLMTRLYIDHGFEHGSPEANKPSSYGLIYTV